MNDPERDKREPVSQRKELGRAPDWVITDWGEPESPVTPKFSTEFVRALVKISLATGVFISAFVLFGDALDFSLQRGHRGSLTGFTLLVCVALILLRCCVPFHRPFLEQPVSPPQPPNPPMD
jgi:hypothetical protein